MKSYTIAVVPGDGVGTEIAREAGKIMDAVADKYGFKVTTESFDWGCDYYLKHGTMMPDDMLDTLRDFDSIFLGCIGDANKVPDHVSLTLLLAIRKGFDQYVNLRPIKLYPGVKTPVRTATPETVDMMVIRENTEGEYSGVGGLFKAGTPDAFALQTGVFTRKGCERVIRYGFELARRRKRIRSTLMWWWPRTSSGTSLPIWGPCSRAEWDLRQGAISIPRRPIPPCLNRFTAPRPSMRARRWSIPSPRSSRFV